MKSLAEIMFLKLIAFLELAMPDDALKYVLSASLELESLYSYYNSSSLEQLKAVFDDFNDNYTRVNNKPFDILNFYNENG